MSGRYYEYRASSYDWGGITYAVQRLILANTIVFAVQLILDIPFGGYGFPLGGFVTDLLSFHSWGPWFLWVWQPVTYMFLHGGLSHLFFNMLMLYVFGPEVERVLGTRQFLAFYLICGALGVLPTLLWVAVPFIEPQSVLGASGAIMGVLIAHAVVNPEREIFLFPFPAPLNVRAVVLIVIVLNLINAMLGGGTSVLTHFGGMGVGYAYMKLVPRMRQWQWRQWGQRRLRSRPKPKHDKRLDDVGEAVDNIFRFEDKKRRGK